MVYAGINGYGDPGGLMLERAGEMFGRLGNYFQIVAACVTVWFLHLTMSKNTHVDSGVRTAGEVVNLVVGLTVAGQAVSRLLKAKRSHEVASPGASPLRLRLARAYDDWKRRTVTPVLEASARHPVQVPLLMSLFLLMPFALRALGMPHGWRDFRNSDWILLGIVDLPILASVVYVVFMSYRSKRK